MKDHSTFLKAVKGNASAITSVVVQYTPLVHKIVRKYCWMAPAHTREDLVQEGLIGVVKALESFEPERGHRFMTWVYPKVRGAVQTAARREKRHPRYALSLEQSDWGHNLEDASHFEVRDDIAADKVKDLLVKGCGSLDSRRAQMICDRFGLLGREPMRQGDVAKKYGLTKQAVQSHLARFNRTIREEHPELRGLI